MAPKTSSSGAEIVKIATYIAASTFNDGKLEKHSVDNEYVASENRESLLQFVHKSRQAAL